MTLGTVAILLVSVSISVRGLIITARNEVGQGYVYVCVILFTGGVSCPGGAGLVPGGCLVENPPVRPLLRAVRILLECILVFSCRI